MLPPRPAVVPPAAARRAATAALGMTALLLGCAPIVAPLLPPAAAAPPGQKGRAPGAGATALRIFDRANVYVVTNDDPALADALLEGCDVKERRVLTPEQWRSVPQEVREYVTLVYLVNRQKLPLSAKMPEKCPATGGMVWTEVTRWGRRWGAIHEVTVSAPDGAWLRWAVEDFRQRKEVPRKPEKREVDSLALVPIGAGADRAAGALVARPPAREGRELLAHRLTPEEADARAEQLVRMDEVYLVDRGSAPAGELPEEVAAVFAGRLVGPNETVVWRERKPGAGRNRVVITAPTAHALEQALARYPDPLTVPTTPTVLSTARDLRQVRRVAVAAVKTGPGEGLARQLATQAASAVRSLNAFEVLERAGLAEVLSEIALGQAGITQPQDRARVRHLAAADALLIVEVTEVRGRTEYFPKHERLTPPMAKPPRRPVEPSRLRYAVSLPGKENDPIARALTDALLRKVVGIKSERDYRSAMRAYNEETIPAYERQLDAYYEERRTRPIKWRQTLTEHRGVTVSGSVRLVDLRDGMVLWEAPFSESEREELPAQQRTVTTYGEESHPGEAECPQPVDRVPEALAARAAEAGLEQAVGALRTTALLPEVSSAVVVSADGTGGPVPSPSLPESPTGRVIDIDGKTILVGLGDTDGVVVGDILTVTLPKGSTARLKVTRVRPRTCDAVLDPAAPAALRAQIAVGTEVRK
jgi:Curli production assembly/transport component CsgG.